MKNFKEQKTNKQTKKRDNVGSFQKLPKYPEYFKYSLRENVKEICQVD